MFRELDDQRRLATILNNLGGVARLAGDDSAALAHFEEAMVLARRAGDRPVLANVLVSLGFVMVRHGRLPAARRHVVEALALIEELRARRAGTAGLEVAAELLFLCGRLLDSVRALGASDASRRTMKLPRTRRGARSSEISWTGSGGGWGPRCSTPPGPRARRRGLRNRSTSRGACSRDLGTLDRSRQFLRLSRWMRPTAEPPPRQVPRAK